MAYIKNFLCTWLVIISLVGASIAVTAKDANASNLKDGLKTGGLIASGALMNRFTPEAMAIDAAQCFSIYIAYKTAKFLSYRSIFASCAGTPGCRPLAEVASTIIGLAAALAVWSSIATTAYNFEYNSFVTGRKFEVPDWSHERSSERKILTYNYGTRKGEPMLYSGGEEKKGCQKLSYSSRVEEVAEKGEQVLRCLNYSELAELTRKGFTDTNDPELDYYNKLCVFARMISDPTNKTIDHMIDDIPWHKKCIDPRDCHMVAGIMTCVDWRQGDYLCAEGVFCSSPFMSAESFSSLLPDDIIEPIYGRVNGGTYEPGEDRHMYNCAQVRDTIKYTPIVPPKYISKTCLRDFKVHDLVFSDFSFTGRMVRCIDLTVKNILKNQYERYQVSNRGTDQAAFVLDENGDPIYEGMYCVGEGLDENGRPNPDYPVPEFDPLTGPGVCEGGFFSSVQVGMEGTVKALAALVLMFLGLKVFVAQKEISRSELMLLAIKFAFVYYFALGDAWKEGYYDYLLLGSSLVGDSLSNAASSGGGYDDGCAIDVSGTNVDGQAIVDSDYAVWDQLDCKYAKYLGWGGLEGGFPELGKFMFNGLFNIFFGILMIIAGIAFVLFLFVIAFKAVYLMITAIIGIALLVFVSPIFIPMVLFEHTKKMFDGWLKQLIGFSLQPIIVFSFLNFTIIVLDSFIYGDTVFDDKGEPSWQIVRDEDGKEVIDKTSCDTTSMICIINDPKLSSFEGEKVLGIPIPTDAAEAAGNLLYSIIKLCFLTFIFSQMWETITSISASLVGGADLGKAGPDVMKKAWGAMTGAWGGMRAAGKRGKSGGHKILNKMRGKDDYGLKP